jgi:non-ribosomal peptide synthetase component F/thioesterase domain-containing protein
MLDRLLTSEWQSSPSDLALDYNGPSEVPFEPWDDIRLDKPIVEIFNEIAARYGDKVAVADDNTRLTYRTLRNASLHLAQRIDALVPAGKPVGILLPNNALFPLAAIACLAAGRPYVPIDPTFPQTRIDDIRDEAGLSAMIFDRVDGKVIDAAGSLPCLDIGSSLDDANEQVSIIANSAGPAVILYTSGSTGRPKGICNDQRAILQRVAQATNSCHLNASDRFFLLSAPGTIAGQRETFAALLNGATLYIADPPRLGIRGVLRLLREAHATVGYIVPALLRQLLTATDAKEAFSHARIVRIGGDIPVADDLALCRLTLPSSCQVLIAFSSTEVPTIFQWFIPPDWQPDGVRLPIGYARPGMSFKIENDDAAEEAGELIVRSRYLALGYWQAGQLQTGPFQSDPTDPSMRILRTGDRVRPRRDGLVEMTGRLDRQIKVHGSRVDLAEIEATLRGLDGVADAAVIARRQGEDVGTLVAYVVPRGTPRPTFVGDIRALLAERLPRRMCPAQFRILDELPRLGGFKTDFRTLERLDQRELADLEAVDETCDNSAPLSNMSDNSRVHKAVAAAWATVLGQRSFRANEAWDEAGGDSLSALHLWCLIEESLDARLAIDSLELNATPAMFIAEVEKQLNSSAGESLAPLVFFLPSADGDTPIQTRFRAAFHNQVRFEVVQYPQWREMIDKGGDFGVLVTSAVSQILGKTDNDICLVGYSFGGFVAAATAGRLMELRRRVRFVGLIDTPPKVDFLASESRFSRAGNLVQKIFFRPASLEVSLIKVLINKSSFGLLRRLGHLANRLPATTAFKFHYHLNYQLRSLAMYRWRLKSIQAPTYLFQTDEFASVAVESWKALATDLEVIPVGGSHFSILRSPAREILCRKFLKALGSSGGNNNLVRPLRQGEFTTSGSLVKEAP